MKRPIGPMLLLLLLTLAACHDGASPTGPSRPTPQVTPKATAPSLTATLRFLESSPPSGGKIVVRGCQGGCTDGLTLRFSATVDRPLPAAASLNVELLDASGRSCAFDFTLSQNLTAGQPTVFETRFLVLESACPLPFSTSAVHATLIGDQMGRPHYVQAAFPLAYTFVEPPPASSTPTAPRILGLSWQANVDAWAGCPLPGEGISVWCDAIDDNDDPMTITLRLTQLRPGPVTPVLSIVRAFPPSPYSYSLEGGFPMTTLVDLRATCEATDAGGLATSRSIDILCACGAGHCYPQSRSGPLP